MSSIVGKSCFLFTSHILWPFITIGQCNQLDALIIILWQYFITLILIHQVNTMSEDTEEERIFRERYAQELGKKKQQNTHSYHGYDELADERRNINQQEM